MLGPFHERSGATSHEASLGPTEPPTQGPGCRPHSVVLFPSPRKRLPCSPWPGSAGGVPSPFSTLSKLQADSGPSGKAPELAAVQVEAAVLTYPNVVPLLSPLQLVASRESKGGCRREGRIETGRQLPGTAPAKAATSQGSESGLGSWGCAGVVGQVQAGRCGGPSSRHGPGGLHSTACPRSQLPRSSQGSLLGYWAASQGPPGHWGPDWPHQAGAGCPALWRTCGSSPSPVSLRS